MQNLRKTWMVDLILCTVAALAGPLMAQAPAAAPAPAPTPPKVAPPGDPIAILKMIPADAAAFVVIRNALEVDSDVSATAEKLGFPLKDMGFPGLLAMIQENLGLKEGLNANSGVGIAILNCAQVKTTQDIHDRAVLLIPTENAQAIVEALGGKKDGETYKVTFGNVESTAAAKNGFLVVARNADGFKEVMQVKGEGIIKTLSPDRLKAYPDQDILAWANPRGISKEVRDEVMTMIKGMMAFAAQAPGAAEQMESSMGQLTKFIDGLKEICLGISLDPKVGLKFTFYYRVLPDSEIGRDVAGMKPGKTPLLAGLPDEPIIFALGSGGGADSAVREKQIRTAMDQVLKPEVVGSEVDPEQLKNLKESAIKLLSSFEQVAASAAGLPGEGQDGMIAVTMVAKVTNSQQAQGEIRKLFGTIKDMVIKAAVSADKVNEEEAKAAKEAIQLKENAEKLTDAVVDHFVIDLSKLPDATPEDIDQVKSIVGQEGVLVRIAAVGDKNLAVTFGGGTKRFAQIVDQVRKEQAPLADRKTIKMISDRLPSQNRLVEAYLGVDRLLGVIADVTRKLGQAPPIPLNMRETAPLALVSTKVDDTAVEAQALVPIEFAQSAAEMVRPMMMMFMGGMGGPGASMPSDEESPETEAPAPAPAPGVK